MSAAEDILEGEIVGTDLVPAQPGALNLFGADSPREIVAAASEHAEALADVIQKKQLYKNIQGKNHVLVEGWTLLGSMLGVFPIVAWTKKLENGWEARVEARTRTGELVGAAEAMCTRDESTWRNRDEYALRSMAQTRATSKALRGPLGFVVQLAGYNATPAEEIPSSGPEPQARGTDGSARVSSPGVSQREASSGPVITEPQHRRLMAIAGGHKVPHDDVKRIAEEIAGVDSTLAIPRSKYDAVVKAVEDFVPF